MVIVVTLIYRRFPWHIFSSSPGSKDAHIFQ